LGTLCPTRLERGERLVVEDLKKETFNECLRWKDKKKSALRKTNLKNLQKKKGGANVSSAREVEKKWRKKKREAARLNLGKKETL